jgi:branched-chain amino acid transport system substrate-binding protein
MSREFRLRPAVLAGLLAALSVVAACGDSNSSGTPAAKTPFKIGLILPLSGPNQFLGQQALLGAQAEARILNKSQKGILGRDIQIVQKDSATDPARGRAAAQDLLDNDKVDVIMPDFFPAITTAILPIVTQAKILSMTTSGSPTVVDPSKYPYEFSLTIPFAPRAPAVAQEVKNLGGKKVGILVSGDSGGILIGDSLRDAYTKAGISIAGYEKYDIAATDVTPQLQKLKNAGTDMLSIYAAGPPMQVVMSGVRDLGWKVTVVADPASATGDLQKLVPAEVANQLYIVGFRILARTGDASVDPYIKPFVDSLKQELGAGQTVSSIIAPAFIADSMKLIKWAMEKAGKVDAAAATKQLESLNSTTLPKYFLLTMANPKYSATDHTPINADFSQSFAVIRVSPVVDGTYKGEPLNFK